MVREYVRAMGERVINSDGFQSHAGTSARDFDFTENGVYGQ